MSYLYLIFGVEKKSCKGDDDVINYATSGHFKKWCTSSFRTLPFPHSYSAIKMNLPRWARWLEYLPRLLELAVASAVISFNEGGMDLFAVYESW